MALTEMMVMYKTSNNEAWARTFIQVDMQKLKDMPESERSFFIAGKVREFSLGEAITQVDFKMPIDEDSPRQFESELLESAPPKWEYDNKIISGTPEQMMITMNALGQLGWEAWYKSHNTNKVYFKRLIS